MSSKKTEKIVSFEMRCLKGTIGECRKKGLEAFDLLDEQADALAAFFNVKKACLLCKESYIASIEQKRL